MIDEFLLTPCTAYFSMEIALNNDIPTYAGGLGILAGDTIRSAADLEIPMVAVTLVSKAGYFKQSLDKEGCQTELPDTWEPGRWATLLNAKIAVTIEERTVWVSGWLYIFKGHTMGKQPVILLDTDLNENTEDDRLITHHLYGKDKSYRLKQEIVLGIGGALMLQALGFQVHQYHMNEGHAALLILELLRRHAYPEGGLRPGDSPYNIPRVRELCRFTTHTPVEAGHDQFSYTMVKRILDEFINIETLKQLAGEDSLNMTALALNMSDYINGVARRHAEISRKMYPGYRIHAITNGVHPHTWSAKSFAKLYDNNLQGWCYDPSLLARAEHLLPDDNVWQAHCEAKASLIQRVKTSCGLEYDPSLPIISFARRMTAYKRPDLLFTDIEKLKAIATKYPFQIILAGKAHPQDEEGKKLIKILHQHQQELLGDIPIAYLPNYDMSVALDMISGSDLWLNTPLSPYEASGTSGMKAAFNGVPCLSILDGWWVEGCIEGVTGWAIGKDGSGFTNQDNANSLYDKLENIILPLYYENRSEWISVMKAVIGLNAAFFNSHRMMRRYATEAYSH